MGVHGLWKLIDSSGKAVPLEALENRILAVDVSIWLYQLVKGFQESVGHSAANAYLLGLFHRICKLLFYRIKPIFVFDGGVPSLKRKTIAARQNNRAKASLMGEKLRQALLENLAKQELLGKALGENVSLPDKLFHQKQDNMFSLPPLPIPENNENDSDLEKETVKYRFKDLQSIDITSDEFLSLPADMRHDILTELKETRKQNSWAKLHLMPEVGDEFSDFQMRRLLKRRAIQVGIEKAEGEMGTRGFTISDLQTILSDQGVDLAQRIAADSSTRLLYHNKEKKISKGISSEASSSQKIKTEHVYENQFTSDSDESISGLAEDINSSEDEAVDKSLTQAEILELIKQESLLSGDKNEKAPQGKSTPLTCTELKNVKTEEGTELALNGAVENEAGNNGIQLEHGTLPQEGSSLCRLSSPALTIPQAPPKSQLPLLSEPVPASNVPAKNNYDDLRNITFDLNKNNGLTKLEHDFDVGSVEFSIKDTNKIEMSKQNILQPEFLIDKKLLEQGPIQESEKVSNLENNEGAHNIPSEESDDDFIEVNDNEIIETDITETHVLKMSDNPIKNTEVLISAKEEPTSTSKPLEIVVNSAATLEDDLFADIFQSKDTSNSKNISDGEELNKAISDPGPSTLPTEIKETEFDITVEQELQEDYDIILPHIAKAPSPVPQLSIKEIVKMKKDLEHESSYLMKETGREDRIASTITEQIRLDAQELLKLFGVPFITAPLEAEAQCAYLDLTGQTQGTITDDSDIWLFGGNNVYKNFFDQKKFVQQFKATDIDKCLHIGRDEMIMLALLSGSDYTLGLTGVGAVTALEVIAHYPKSGHESTPVERLRRFSKEFKTKSLLGSIAKKLKKADLSEGFPSAEVVKAYLDPEVDKSSEPFSWSKPNVKEIRRYVREKFGWDQAKTDKILEPVLENLKKTQTQGTLHRFFDWNLDHLENTRSKRIENALNLLKTPSLLAEPGPSKPRPPIQGKKKNATDNDILMKSKTPSQIARERAAKKFKELKRQGKVGPKSRNK